MVRVPPVVREPYLQNLKIFHFSFERDAKFVNVFFRLPTKKVVTHWRFRRRLFINLYYIIIIKKKKGLPSFCKIDVVRDLKNIVEVVRGGKKVGNH